MTELRIREEAPADRRAIYALTKEAFESAPHSSGTEQDIVDALREEGALSLSLVAKRDGSVVGHVAFSPLELIPEVGDWYALGPVSVSPRLQRQGIGTALIEAGLARLRDLGASGCALLGDPAFYGRFGFRRDERLELAMQGESEGVCIRAREQRHTLSVHSA